MAFSFGFCVIMRTNELEPLCVYARCCYHRRRRHRLHRRRRRRCCLLPPLLCTFIINKRLCVCGAYRKNTKDNIVDVDNGIVMVVLLLLLLELLLLLLMLFLLNEETDDVIVAHPKIAHWNIGYKHARCFDGWTNNCEYSVDGWLLIEQYIYI